MTLSFDCRPYCQYNSSSCTRTAVTSRQPSVCWLGSSHVAQLYSVAWRDRGDVSRRNVARRNSSSHQRRAVALGVLLVHCVSFGYPPPSPSLLPTLGAPLPSLLCCSPRVCARPLFLHSLSPRLRSLTAQTGNAQTDNGDAGEQTLESGASAQNPRLPTLLHALVGEQLAS